MNDLFEQIKNRSKPGPKQDPKPHLFRSGAFFNFLLLEMFNLDVLLYFTNDKKLRLRYICFRCPFSELFLQSLVYHLKNFFLVHILRLKRLNTTLQGLSTFS